MQAVHHTGEIESERGRAETSRLIDEIAREVVLLYADDTGTVDLECVERHLRLIVRRVTLAERGRTPPGRFRMSGPNE